MLEALVMAILRFLARILLLCINFWTFITNLPARCTRLVLALLNFEPIAWLGSGIALALFFAIRSGYQMILETAKLLALREELEAELERQIALRTIKCAYLFTYVRQMTDVLQSTGCAQVLTTKELSCRVSTSLQRTSGIWLSAEWKSRVSGEMGIIGLAYVELMSGSSSEASSSSTAMMLRRRW